MRIVVVGLGKSGTTALIYAIRSAMPADTELLFEPHAFVPVREPNVAAKALLNPRIPLGPEFYRQFERIVLLLRDPRDLLISKALYRVYGGTPLHADRAKLEEYVALLRAKEDDPRSVSFLQIVALFQTLNGRGPNPDAGIAKSLNYIAAFQRAFPECLALPIRGSGRRTVRGGRKLSLAVRRAHETRRARDAAACRPVAPRGQLARLVHARGRRALSPGVHALHEPLRICRRLDTECRAPDRSEGGKRVCPSPRARAARRASGRRGMST